MGKMNNKRILLIDDEEPMRNYIRDVLEKEGFSIIECTNGAQGIEKLSEYDFDIVLTDIMMPGKDGIELLIDLKKRHCHAKIVVMSGAADCAKLLPVADIYKADATIRKPFKKEELLSIIRIMSKRQKVLSRCVGYVKRFINPNAFRKLFHLFTPRHHFSIRPY